MRRRRPASGRALRLTLRSGQYLLSLSASILEASGTALARSLGPSVMTEKASLRQVALMSVAVMRVRKVRMRVSDRVVLMPMGVPHLGHHEVHMRVLVTLVLKAAGQYTGTPCSPTS